ncbi:MAG: hypothetical protein LUE86_00990, partial [Clostridiales bacterium]|nr:hypothetical protein [Clostridiales bacterium]
YDDTGMWRKRIGYTDGVLKNIYIAVSKQYLFEHQDAVVPKELDFNVNQANRGMAMDEVEVALDNELFPDSELLSDNKNVIQSDLPDVYIGEDSSLKHVTINNIELRFPMSVPDFLATGLELNGGRDFVEEDKYVIFDTPVEGGTLGILVVNPYHGLPEEQADVMDCYVAGVYYESSNCSGEGFRTGNGLTGKNPKGTVDEILGPGGLENGRLCWKISEGDQMHRVEYSYSNNASSEPTDVFILFATFSDKSETTNDSTEVYISDDGQTITIDRILSEVTIHGYSEEGEFTISDLIFWMEGDDNHARRQIYNSSGEYNGYQDYLFEDGTLTVETYDINYNYIGSSQDGEYTLTSD